MHIESWCGPERQAVYIGGCKWSVSRLIALSKDFPVMEIPLDHLCIDYKYENVRLREFVKHMRAVEAADLSFPIILDEDGYLMDGRHRIMKALYLGHKTIKAVRFDENPPPDRGAE